MTMMDKNVRENHMYIEGITVGIDDKFYALDGDEARYPGDFSSAANNANCRCVLKFI